MFPFQKARKDMHGFANQEQYYPCLDKHLIMKIDWQRLELLFFLFYRCSKLRSLVAFLFSRSHKFLDFCAQYLEPFDMTIYPSKRKYAIRTIYAPVRRTRAIVVGATSSLIGVNA